MRKKVDSRIRTLVENCVKTGQRSMFVIVGDKGRDQVRPRCSSCFPQLWEPAPMKWLANKCLGRPASPHSS
jgi:hypothetical protein